MDIGQTQYPLPNRMIAHKTQPAFAFYNPTAWKINLKLIEWRLLVIELFLVILGLFIVTTNPTPQWPAIRVLEAFIPLITALQVAFLLPPDGTPMLELLCTYPRSLPRILLERWLVVMVFQGGLGVLGTAVSLSLTGGAWGASLLRWVPPTLFLSSLVLFVTHLTRQGTFGALATVLLWIGFFFAGDMIVFRYPVLTPIHFYLPPNLLISSDYTQNRWGLFVLAAIFMFITLNLLRDTERVMGWRQFAGWHKVLKQLPATLLMTAVLVWAVSVWVWVDGNARRSYAPVCCLTPADAGLVYESVMFTSSDGTALAGWYIPPQNEAVIILLHGYNGHRGMMLPQAAMLAEQGYGVLLYDLRGHGESGGNGRSLGWQDVADAEAAIDFLQHKGVAHIGLFGFSAGGQVALRTAVSNPTVEAVAADAPGYANAEDFPPPTHWEEWWDQLNAPLLFQLLSWRTKTAVPPSLVSTISQIAPRPILLIATGSASFEQRYFAQAGDPKTLWLIPDVEHGGGPAAHPEEYASRLVAFFDQTFQQTP